jgi:hypothetical protein
VELSNHFSLEDFTFSQTAIRHGINNRPGREILSNIITTAEKMDKIQDLLGKKIRISSGYRSQELNTRIGSKPSSQHTKGQAVDFTCSDFGSPREIIIAILNSGIEFDQLILEFNSWVHISFVDNNNRNQALIIDKNGTRVFS